MSNFNGKKINLQGAYKMNNKITHSGELDLGTGIKIPCFVLEDGTRVLSGRAVQEAMRIREKPEGGGKRGGYILPKFFNAKVLKSFVEKKLKVANLNPIICQLGNQTIHGYEATILVDLCDAVLEARRSGEKLTERQEIVANQCEILIRSFAKVGIIALIDEATGYQYDREKFELQTILKLFISEDILEWQKTFHLGFYKEIFRLWGVPFTPQNIKRKPPFIGNLTNELIYKNLPKGSFVLKRLKEKTPKTEAGNYKVRLFQSLTPLGREELKKVLYSVESLAVISDSKAKFKRLVQDRYGQREIPFPEYDEPETQKIEKPTAFDKVLKGMLTVPPPPKNEKESEG
jgi:hypothetical protein